MRELTLSQKELKSLLLRKAAELQAKKVETEQREKKPD